MHASRNFLLALGFSVALLSGCGESPRAGPGDGSVDANQGSRTDATAEDARQAPDFLLDGPPPSPTCTSDNCSGCCSGYVCIRGYAQMACGRGGQACSPCAAPLSCIAGECKEGTLEICNGEDDDGDGDEDEGCDSDSDSHCTDEMTADEAPSCPEHGADDCDDLRPMVHSGATEICNGQDDDCDGNKDEDGVCDDQGALGTRPVHMPRIAGKLSCVAHAATNKIYCFGGWDAPTESDQILEFDPSNNGLEVMTAKLPTPRYGLSCAPSGDKIFCFGGYWQQNKCTKRESYGCVAVTATPVYLHDIFEYDPATNTVTSKKATLPGGRMRLSCAVNSESGKIYCFGGAEWGPTIKDDILEYDPGADTLNRKNAKLPAPSQAMSCAEDSATHTIYCFGGHDGSIGLRGAMDGVLAYDSTNDKVTALTVKLDPPRADPACVEHSGTHKIYCLGGVKPFEALGEIVEFDATGPSLDVSSTALTRKKHSLACVEEAASHSVFCFGGSEHTVLYDDVLEFKP